MHFSIIKLKQIQSQLTINNPKKNSIPRIVAVSKTFSIEKIKPLIDYGHNHFGENKIQEALKKWFLIKKQYPNIKLHMIGKIQSNKAKNLLPLFDYIHSLDSLKVARILSNQQEKLNLKPKIFIQINIANESQKNGILIKDLELFYSICSKELKLNIIGLMCLPPVNENSEKYFRLLNDLKMKYRLKELSMGMSNDYLLAIKHGSTFLRLGSSIFGSRY